MTVATATPQQLAELGQYVVMMRAVSSQLAKTMSQMNALSNSYNATISAIIGGPGIGQTLTDGSGLAGIVPLTDTDVVNITFIFQSILTSWYDSAHQQLLTRACGPGNTQ